MRIGFALGYDPAAPLRDLARWMREAEDRGFEMGFFSETINLVRDSVSALAAFAGTTSALRLGAVQVVRLRSPVLMALTAASLDELSAGRLVLAPGAATANHARVHGFDLVDPALALAEWVEAIRRLLTGEPVTYAGQVVRLNGVRLGWKPARAAIPMWIAATSRRGLELAGRIGDGVLLNAVASPEYSAAAVRIVRQAVEAAGRDWDRFEVAQIVPTSVADTREAAVAAIRWEVASKFHPQRMRYNARIRAGVGEPYLDEAGLPALAAAFERGGMDALAAALPESTVAGMTACGTPDQVRARVERYRTAGVRLPLVRPAAPGQMRRVLDLFKP